MPKDNLKSKVDGNKLDLSLGDLSSVPVKDLLAVPKATHLDLSCNLLVTLTDDFCQLSHLIKLDLSKNKLRHLPDNFGVGLPRLQHLDLFQNQLATLPVSFFELKKLVWLDVKDNQLEEPLLSVAGDCLDEVQCRKCASNVVAFMRKVQGDQERLRQKKLQEEREKEAAKKAEEEKGREKERAEKKVEKERRKREHEARRAADTTSEKAGRDATREDMEETKRDDHLQKSGKVGKIDKRQKGVGISCCGIFLALLVCLLAALVGIYLYCQSSPGDKYCAQGRSAIRTYWILVENTYRNLTST